ncbi:S41 family peptidase [Brevundimonas poindexterae]|uniref:S41 family peptidase n=1 Tax=Brevundimonas poindexterae TaxID=74325 RepID=UPI001CFE676B|nr:S41 family peptidase [Brevundimonas poindexterae]
MKRLAISVLCIVSALAGGHAVQAQNYGSVFDAVDRTVRENFYDPHFGGRDWSAIVDRRRVELDAVTSDAEFQRLIQSMLSELGVSHVLIQAPGTNRPTMGLAARWEIIDGQTIIVDIDPASAARAAGLRIGDRIIDPSMIRGPRQDLARLDIERCDGSVVQLSLPRESAYWPPRERTISWSLLRRGDGRSIGYLRAERFGDDAAELIDAAMDTLGSTDGLIIDIRNNSGGNASALRLLGYFTDPGPGIALLSRPFLETLDGPVEAEDLTDILRVSRAYTTEAIFAAVAEGDGAVMLMIEDLGERRYRKPVVILIGPETGSAAEGFAWGAREQTDAVLIGRETAGALLSSQPFDLPDGWRLTIPVHGNWGPDGRDFGDKKVPPHIATTLTREAVCRGEDVDLSQSTVTLERQWGEQPL